MCRYFKLTIILNCLASVILFTGFGCSNVDVESEDQSPAVGLIAKLLPDSSQQKREKLQEQLLSPDADLRREAVYLLNEGEASKWEVTSKILALMAREDPDELVRVAALEVLTELDGADTSTNALEIELLIAVSKDRSTLVRSTCTKALTKRGDEKSLNILLEMLTEDEDHNVRSEAASSLKYFPDKKAFRHLVAGLADEQFAVSYQSRKSLRQLSGRDFGFDQAQWRNWLSSANEPIKKINPE